MAIGRACSSSDETFSYAVSWCFNALLPTQYSSLVWLLPTYKDANHGLGHKTIGGVWITQLDRAKYPTGGPQFRPTLVWKLHAADPQTDEKCASAWNTFTVGERLPLTPQRRNGRAEAIVGSSTPANSAPAGHGDRGSTSQRTEDPPIECYPGLMRAWSSIRGSARRPGNDPLGVAGVWGPRGQQNQPSAQGSGSSNPLKRPADAMGD